MFQMRLDDEQRAFLYRVSRDAWTRADSNRFAHKRRSVMLMVRADLAAAGWESMLINVAIQLLLPILVKWLESFLDNPEFQPPAAMPVLFAVDGAHDHDI